ncbi:MAG: UDP-N-acetylmuramate--L-alanine ligase [Lachnospiraceae bacterium]|jgi:UDP-N-acetylmuramate--alanine ligase|nr:UDP-N-acetylmuramate--L-alanine ligase [Lachnospiraceae bacterium]
MYQIDFQKPLTVYFIGIGGISMSGLAEILLQEGFAVRGSDAHESGLTDHLEGCGAKIFYGQRAENIGDGIDLAVYTAAIHPDNPEYQEVKRRGIPMLSRAELLGQMMKNYHHALAIAGTHGKTTTTSMVTEILLAADMDPTVSVGGILHSIGGNIRVGGQELFVTEACEYTNSFLEFFPTIEVILNIEADHLDFFKDLDDIRHSFKSFAGRLPKEGLLILDGAIDNPEEITQGLACQVVILGHGVKGDYGVTDISYDEVACPSFTLMKKGVPAGRIRLGVPGEHNVYNALAAVAAAEALGVPMEAILKGLAGFSGTERRFEKKGKVGGITIIDDYAHHPQEIAATLRAAKNYPHKKLWCVFQPHTYSRTKALLDDFARELAAADQVVLAEIYPARETDTLGVSSEDIGARIAKLGTPVSCFSTFDEIETFILKNCSPGDLLITMGAGDIVKVGERLLGK